MGSARRDARWAWGACSSEKLSSRWLDRPVCSWLARAPQGQPSPLEGLVGPSAGAAGAVTLLPAQALNPAGAGAGGKAGQSQGAEPHVFAGHDELPEPLLVREGVARAPGTGAAHPPQAAVLGLLLLPHQLGVAHLGRSPPATALASHPRTRAPEPPGRGCAGFCPKQQWATASSIDVRAGGLPEPPSRSPRADSGLLTVSERSGFRLSLRNRKATTGMMQTTVVRVMVSHTVGWARVFWALPGERSRRRPWESRADEEQPYLPHPGP